MISSLHSGLARLPLGLVHKMGRAGAQTLRGSLLPPGTFLHPKLMDRVPVASNLTPCPSPRDSGA